MLKYAASLSTSLPNGRVRTEIKSDEKPIIVIDNYDSFTYNLCQDKAKSMQQSEHEDVVMEARVRGPSWFSFGYPYSRCTFSLGRKNPPPCTFMGRLMFSRAGGTFIRSHIGGGTVDLIKKPNSQPG